MAQTLELDSLQRDRVNFPDPANYQTTSAQIETWFSSARTIVSHPRDPKFTVREFATTVDLRSLVVPFSAVLADVPRLYVNIRSVDFRDIHLIHSINGVHPMVKFVCEFDKVQNDSAGNPLWLHFKGLNEQTMRFKRRQNIEVQVTTRSGAFIPNGDIGPAADPNEQTLITLVITPYIRDDDYSNHLEETFVDNA